MLEIAHLSVQYGKHRAVDDIGLAVAGGEIVVVLGANGAGKSSLLKAVAGLLRPGAGTRVTLGGRDLVGLPAHAIVEAGLALVPEGRGIFGELTVRENLLLGAFARRARADEERNRARVLALFPRLAERLDQTARTMSGGEQQMVAIGRALMSNPRVLLCDEISLGLAPIVVRDIYAAFPRILTAGASIVIVEQDIGQALKVADRLYCLMEGRVTLTGTPSSVTREAIHGAYFGAPRP